jgi:GntR family transcriptional regulator, N-acetylglucosamine utilization regulator
MSSAPQNTKGYIMNVKPVELNEPLPRYYQVYAALLERIKSGEFQPGDAIPSERILVNDYQVSRITIGW